MAEMVQNVLTNYSTTSTKTKSIVEVDQGPKIVVQPRIFIRQCESKSSRTSEWFIKHVAADNFFQVGKCLQ
jgi:hypothetical protein